MPKAGSTALQTALASAREPLARRGILYPRGPFIPRTHNFLIAGIADKKRELPRLLHNAYRDRIDEIEPAFAKWMASLKSTVASRRPETLVLSSEWLFRLRADSKFDRLSGILRSLGGSVEVIAYVRRPSDQYLSSAQQILKGSHVIKPVAPIRYRAPLEGFARIADRIHVVKYDRADFPGGDIVRHFIETFMPEARDIAEGVGAATVVNTTISAEGMFILARYRRVNHRRQRNRFTSDTDRLLEAIRAADVAVGGDLRPRLLEPVRAAIDLASADLIWLRDVYGIVFGGIDYDRIVAPAMPIREMKHRPKRIDEICVVDPERLDKLTMRTLYALTTNAELRRYSAPLRAFGLWLKGVPASGRR
jgi:hypothetical protein